MFACTNRKFKRWSVLNHTFSVALSSCGGAIPVGWASRSSDLRRTPGLQHMALVPIGFWRHSRSSVWRALILMGAFILHARFLLGACLLGHPYLCAGTEVSTSRCGLFPNATLEMDCWAPHRQTRLYEGSACVASSSWLQILAGLTLNQSHCRRGVSRDGVRCFYCGTRET